MPDIPDDRCERHRLFEAMDRGFKAGDFAGLAKALGSGPGWVDTPLPHEFGLGHPLEYAIYWSPVAFILELIEAGANTNYEDDAGFPAIIAALSASRPERLEIVSLLIERGADPNRRGVNDWTPLHYAVSLRDDAAIGLLLSGGGDPTLRTRIDDRATALEDAEAAGFDAGAALLRRAHRHPAD